MKTLIAILALAVCGLAAEGTKVAGKWQFAIDTPHGNMPGVLTVEQDGNKLTGNCDLTNMGVAKMTGSIDGKKVSMKFDMHGNPLALTGTIEGDKMSGSTDPAGGTWKATKQ